MDLWIRTQDREDLVKVKNIHIGERYDSSYHISANHDDNYVILGKYKSKERALEVLDIIQQNIFDSSKAGDYEGNYEELDLYLKTYIAACMVRVYEMPEV